MEPSAIEAEKQLTAENSRQNSVTMTAMSDADAKAESSETTTPVADGYPHGTRLAAIAISLMLSMFLVALDNVSRSLLGTQ